LEQTLAATAMWYRTLVEHNQVISRKQISNYITDAVKLQVAWSSA
jgi:hypothetical protein